MNDLQMLLRAPLTSLVCMRNDSTDDKNVAMLRKKQEIKIINIYPLFPEGYMDKFV
jgi:hypothetical protein